MGSSLPWCTQRAAREACDSTYVPAGAAVVPAWAPVDDVLHVGAGRRKEESVVVEEGMEEWEAKEKKRRGVVAW